MRNKKNVPLLSDHSDIDMVIIFSMFYCSVALLIFGVLFFALNWIVSSVSLAFCLLVFAAGLYVKIRGIYKKPDRRYLREKGIRISTGYVGSQENDNLMIAQNLTYTASYANVVRTTGINPVTGREMTFESDYLWFDPRIFLKKGGSKIDVYVDPKRPDRYFMDLSFLEDEANKLLEENPGPDDSPS